MQTKAAAAVTSSALHTFFNNVEITHPSDIILFNQCSHRVTCNVSCQLLAVTSYSFSFGHVSSISAAEWRRLIGSFKSNKINAVIP